MTEYNLSSTELDKVQNHEDFIVVWLSSTPTEIENFGGYLKKYTAFKDGINCMKQIQSEGKIFLVLCDFFEHVSYLNSFSPIRAIYILNKHGNYEDGKHSKQLMSSKTKLHLLIDYVRIYCFHIEMIYR